MAAMKAISLEGAVGYNVLLKDPLTGGQKTRHSDLELFIHHTTALPPEPLPVQSVPRHIIPIAASLDSISQ